jgi:hypothetical protein
VTLKWIGQEGQLPPPNPFGPTPFTAEQYAQQAEQAAQAAQTRATVVAVPLQTTTAEERRNRALFVAGGLVAAGIIAALVLR